MVQVTVSGGGQLQGAEADVVESLVVEQEAFVSILNELVEAEHGVVGLDDRVRHFGTGDDGERLHDTVRVLLADLGDEQGAHATPGAATEGMAHLEALETVTSLGFFPHHVEY